MSSIKCVACHPRHTLLVLHTYILTIIIILQTIFPYKTNTVHFDQKKEMLHASILGNFKKKPAAFLTV